MAQDGLGAPGHAARQDAGRAGRPSAWPRSTRSKRASRPLRPRPKRPAACSASAHPTAPASCRAWASSTASPTTTSSTRAPCVRQVEAAHEHPFIRRDMDRCIACGRCVRVCRDVAGPACYDFSGPRLLHQGRHALRRGPAACRLHHLRALRDRLPDRRAHLERARAALVPQRRVALHHVPPVRRRLPGRRHQGDQRLRRGARPLARARRPRASGLAGGHRMCAGCGAPIVVRQVLMGTADPVVVAAATGCLEVVDDDLPLHLVDRQLHPHRLRELGRHAERRRDRLPLAQEAGQDSTTTSSSSPSAATAAPTTSACSRSRAPWSAATRCSTSATTTAPT